MIDITVAFCITIVACIVTYFWGKSQFNYKEFMDIWYVWMPALFIFVRYIKGIKDGWHE